MSYLLDTSILMRLANSADISHGVALRAVSALIRQGEVLYLCPQKLIEFRNGATRPAQSNGLGLLPAAEEALADAWETAFVLLPETPDLFPAWRTLIRSLGVCGKQVHDARLAAFCQIHGISHILTFNVQHFTRFTTLLSSLTVVDPAAVS
jgi:predicted nucleic acid-binding protein